MQEFALFDIFFYFKTTERILLNTRDNKNQVQVSYINKIFIYC